MNQNYFWKILLIVFVLAFALWESNPPTARPLLDVFQEEASNKDQAFSNIVARAQAMGTTNATRQFGNLQDAIDTNRIAGYFPTVNVEGEENPNRAVLNALQQKAAGKIKLGIDLQGGASFMVQMQTEKLDTNVQARPELRERVLSEAVEILRKRVDALGVAEPVIQPIGTDRIEIQMPGLSEADLDEARKKIQQAAFLEFRMVHKNNFENLEKGIVPPGYELLVETRVDRSGKKQRIPALVKIGPEDGLTGKYLKRAWMDRDELTGRPQINFELNLEGAQMFGEITKRYAPYQTPNGQRHHQLAIVLDGVLYSSPNINEPITGGSGVINGDFTATEAVQLANVLENPLEAPVKIIEERTVAATLGQDSIKAGIKASIIALILVAIFMLFYYLMAGAIANAALIFNIIVLVGIMCSLPATFTLPGIAGIVLTIGLAVDANVLIFERIREELREGKSLRGSVTAGYQKAFGTILDANVTTLISAFILMMLGTGPVKGFGVTLFTGIIISMFTALFFTRLVFDLLLVKGVIRNVKMLQIFGKTKIDFLQWSKPAFTITWILIIGGMAYAIFGRGSEVLGHEFTGGDSLRIGFEQQIEESQARDALANLDIGSPMVQYQTDLSTGEENLLITSKFGSGDQVFQTLNQAFPDAKLSLLAIDKVGPVVGAEILQSAIKAMLWALFGILVYVAIRFEFSFAIGAIVAILHDVLMTIAVFCLFGREFSAPMVAAILTIVGFSINDTIVIFDRIREDLKLGVRGSFKEIMNIAINQTLSRTIITSGTTLMVTLALFIFGGGVINDFAFTLMVGVLTGTYSSIYIASSIVLWWHKGEIPRAATPVILGEDQSLPQQIT